VEKLKSQAPYLEPSRPVSERVESLLGQMTLEEKLVQLTAFWFYELLEDQKLTEEKMQSLLGSGIGQITRVGGASTLPPVEAAKTGNMIQRFLVEQTRLGIPAILHEECCAGYMGLGGTIFPQMIGLASSWNPPLAEQMTAEIRKQLLAIGARQGLAPVLDIAHDPRWGRTEETFGEDPLLVSHFGNAYIRGLQGDGMSTGLMATGKHFVGHSLSNGGLNCGPVTLGPQALWETFLMPFQAAITEAGLRSMMNAYPELDGELVAASREILTDLLRNKLGFDGLVVSDYDAITMINFFHKVAPDHRSAAVMAMRAGIDVELPTRLCYADPLKAAIEDGDVKMNEVDVLVGRVLEAKFKLGLFENPYVDEERVMEVFDTKEQRALAREAALQSMVLLKNDNNTLPLSKPRKLAVIGPNADAPRNMMGDYSYQATLELMTFAPMPGTPFIGGADMDLVNANVVACPSVLDGLREYLGSDTEVLYAQGCPVLEADRSGFDEAVQIANQADQVILVLGDKSGLTPSCSSGETRDSTTLTLPGVQEELAKAVIATGKPVMVVLVNGRPLSIPWLHENAPAILEAWLPGEEGAAAITQTLFGEANPGGKLPISIPRSVGQLPVYYNHKPSGQKSNWYIDYIEMSPKALYPFGYGLSYTSFEYSDLSISTKQATVSETVEISCRVTNTGKVAGDEVVQLYVNDEFASSPRPVKELKGYIRLTLKPGESQQVTFELPVDLLAFYDRNLDLIIEAGTIKIMIGSSSVDIRLEGSFEIGGPQTQSIPKRLFHCPVKIQ
jgi:beta-glucosidase